MPCLRKVKLVKTHFEQQQLEESISVAHTIPELTYHSFLPNDTERIVNTFLVQFLNFLAVTVRCPFNFAK